MFTYISVQCNTKVFFSLQVRLLERRLGEVAWTPTEQSERADEFQQTLFEKEKVIKNLEGEVESQVRSPHYPVGK